MDRPLVQVTAPMPGKQPLPWSNWDWAQKPDDPEP